MPQFITESAATFYVQFTSFFPFVTLSSASLVAFCLSKMLQRPTRHLSREALTAGVFVVFLRHSPAASALRLTKSTLPQGREGTVAKCPSPPRGRRWPLGRMRGLSPAIQLLKSKIKNQKSKTQPPHPSPLPQGGEGTVAKCPSPPRGRRWPSGRMRGLSPAIQLLKSKIENQKHNPLTLALSPAGARGQSQKPSCPRGAITNHYATSSMTVSRTISSMVV